MAHYMFRAEKCQVRPGPGLRSPHVVAGVNWRAFPDWSRPRQLFPSRSTQGRRLPLQSHQRPAAWLRTKDQ